MNKFAVFLAKLTSYPLLFWFWFKPKIFYENKKAQSRKIKGAAIIASNHLSFDDFSLFWVFITRTVRFLIGEMLMTSKGNRKLFTALGCIKIDRINGATQGLNEAQNTLLKGGVICMFPEARLPYAGENRPLPFKHGAAQLSLYTQAQIIPVYKTKTSKFRRTYFMIGTPVIPTEIMDEHCSEQENAEKITAVLQERVLQLKNLLSDKLKERNVTLYEG